jgi:two-component system sensor histidine kinase YesM
MGHRPVKSLQNFLARGSFVTTLLAIAMIGLFNTVFISFNIRKYTGIICRQEINRMTVLSENFIERLRGFITDFSYTPDFQRLLLDYNHGINQNANTVWLALNRYWESYENILSWEINNAAVFALNGDILGSLRGFYPSVRAGDFDWFEELEKSQGETLWLGCGIDPGNRNAGRHTITLVKKIRAVGKNIGEDLGYLLIYIDSAGLRELIAGDLMPPHHRVYIIDRESAILAGDNRDYLGTRFPRESGGGRSVIYHDGDWYLYYSAPIETSGWTIVYLTSMIFLLRDTGTVLLVYVVSTVLTLLFFFIVSIYAAGIITRPIRALQKRFSLLENGDFDAVPGEETGIQEIDELTERFTRMVGRLKNLIDQNYAAKLREQTMISAMKESEIKTLQLQMNPHFLYNTLDSINWMALSAGNRDISRVVLALGNFFRSNVSSSEVYTTLEKDLENVRNYLFIQNVRFEEKLEYEFRVEDGISNYPTLRFMLQPLVENSIKYGLENCEHPCTVIVTVKKAEDGLWIEVRDNGNGMDRKSRDSLREQWERIETLETAEAGLGLFNIMKRLNLCYPDKARFEVDSAPGEGTAVRVYIPQPGPQSPAGL